MQKVDIVSNWHEDMKYDSLNPSHFLLLTHFLLPFCAFWLFFSHPGTHIYLPSEYDPHQLIRLREHRQPSKDHPLFCNYKVPSTTWESLTLAPWTTKRKNKFICKKLMKIWFCSPQDFLWYKNLYLIKIYEDNKHMKISKFSMVLWDKGPTNLWNHSPAQPFNVFKNRT